MTLYLILCIHSPLFHDHYVEDDSISPDYFNSKYECLRPTPLKPYHNRKLIALLRLLERQREVNMEERNALSYRHAIAAIKAYPRKLRSGKEAHKITGIGEKISTLVQLYIDTGTIPDAENLLSDEKFRTLSLFVKVFGVGTKTANMWYNSGYRTLKEVLEKAKLVKAVKLGIQLLPHFDQS
ncbi:DNA polymerase beta, N-terminal domain-like protein [Lichtheimia hyalospora FSU 10163]|nr:DNA polymerase beta, N-terminal domain-like protein [Lichtheimia hyalospora FSU 10163]